MMEQEKTRSLFDVFVNYQETFEDAKKKSSEESSKRASFFRFAKDGTYNIRILPLAPVQDADGNFLPLERKGYEYPLRSQMMKIENEKKTAKGKPAITYVAVCNAKLAFKNIESDLIDKYVEIACEKYSDDEQLIKKLREGSFSGGLKWDSKRCMYIINLDNPEDGIQILQLSFSQYKDLEERKLNLWAKLNRNGKNAPCPISSINAAYPVEIIRKTENGKASYSFNIDTVADKNALDEATLQQLLDMPRLPEQIYRYTRYHLEATIAYLNQMDDKYDIDVMNTDEIQDCIAQIKLLLPSDDQSHFTMSDKNINDEDSSVSVDSLWKKYDALVDADLDDQTEEGQELRSDILSFIDANNLNVKVTRQKTNEDILNEIEGELANSEEPEEPVAKSSNRKPIADDEFEQDDEQEVPSDDDRQEEVQVSNRRRERNEDTNEPAIHASRRGARPPRRRD